MVMSTEQQYYQGDTGWKEVVTLMVPHSQCTLQGTKRTKKEPSGASLFTHCGLQTKSR